MPHIQTALGPIDAADLGFTLSHEHAGMRVPLTRHYYPWLDALELQREGSIRELREAKAGGVDAIIELSTPDLGRDAALLAEISRASGVHMVVATGLWRDLPTALDAMDPDEIADIFVREIEVGIEETGIRAGVIKVANDAEGVTARGERVLRAAGRAARRTNVPISTHHWAPLEVGRRQWEIFDDEGVPPHLVCIGHSADSTDVDYLEDLLKAGVYVSMDRYPGVPPRPEWRDRNRTVEALLDRGWAHRLMLGHDYARDYRKPPTPVQEQHYLFLSKTALPAMRADGVPAGDDRRDDARRAAPVPVGGSAGGIGRARGRLRPARAAPRAAGRPGARRCPHRRGARPSR